MKTKRNAGNAALLMLLLSAVTARAQDAVAQSTPLQDATTAAQIAAQNAATAQSNATAAAAAATAQQTLATAQLANQKSQIDNIQSTLSSSGISGLRQTGTLTPPTTNAIYAKLLSEQLESWLDVVGAADTPTAGIKAGPCTSVTMSRASLTSLTLAFRSVDAKLLFTFGRLVDGTASLKNLQPASTPAPPAKAPGGGPPTKPAGGALAITAAASVGTALASFALNVAAAAKTQTSLATVAISPASKIVNAAIAKHIGSVAYYDPDLAMSVLGSSTAPTSCPATSAAFRALSVEDKANCLQLAIETASAEVAKKKRALVGIAAPATGDPNAELRATTASLDASATQATTDLGTLFALDKTANVLPFVSALQGEALSKALSQPQACVLSVNAISSDADSLVRDGTFSTYKLFIATTTTLAWSVSRPQGQILNSGFKSIATTWTRQALD